jgi:hypothetical protein
MKILAASQHGFIVEMTADEIANCAGYYYAGSMPKRPEIAQELDVTEAYATASELVSSAALLHESKDKLKKVIGVIETFEARLIPITKSVAGKMPNK